MANKINIDFDKGSSLFGLFAVAVAVLAIGLVVAKTLVDYAQYNGRVIAKRSEVQDIINSNNENKDAFLNNYEQLTNESFGPDVLFQIISTEYDFAGFTTIMNTIAQSSGVTLGSISSSTQTESLNQISNQLNTEPQAFAISVGVTGSYNNIRQFISNMQDAAQPIEIKSMELGGGGDELTASFQIESYYQQRIGISAGEESVR